MAKTVKAATPEAEEVIPLTAAKVKRMVIKNFRCIGADPVQIDLDDIVVLVGPNNAGKSTILRAYEVVMNDGGSDGKLKREDFPAEEPHEDRIPEIELQTYVAECPDGHPAASWLHDEPGTGRKYVRERWRWLEPDVAAKRQGFKAGATDWDDSMPWGPANIAKPNRPMPHRVEAFSEPETQAAKIIDIMKGIMLEKAKLASGEEVSQMAKLEAEIIKIKQQIIDNSKADIADIEAALSKYLSEIFPGFKVELDAKNKEIPEKTLEVFAAQPLLRMGATGGHMAPIDKQGSGARRTLLWSALKIISDRQPAPTPKKTIKAKKAAISTPIAVPVTAPISENAGGEEVAPIPEPVTPPQTRPHVLLLDEPEICLHPNAVRDACKVLYDLAAEGSGWQVMVTTHSPAFIDISRDNTTIVRVERTHTGAISGTTVFRPETVQLTENDKELLKLLNQWDNHLAEFFFGGKTIIVEGDTEYSVFRYIVEEHRDEYRDVHIVRARGKYTIPALIKVLNHFGSSYAVMHDSDRPKLKNGNNNGAWTANAQILEAVKNKPAMAPQARLTACVPNFEEAVFGEASENEKPYTAVQKIKADVTYLKMVKDMLDYLTFKVGNPPACLTPWDDVQVLEVAVKPFEQNVPENQEAAAAA